MCLNYARRIWIKLLFPTPLCWMLLNIISWSVMIPAQTTSHNPKTIILSLEIFLNQHGNTSDLLINSFCCWLFDHGVIIILVRYAWNVSGVVRGCAADQMDPGWYRARGDNHQLLPISTPGPQVWPGSNMRWGTGHEEFYFLWTSYSFCEDDTIDLLKRVDSIQTQRQRGQASWMAPKKL